MVNVCALLAANILRKSVSFSFFMIGISESKLSRAQADVKPCLEVRVNCDLLNNVFRTAFTPFQRIFAATSVITLTVSFCLKLYGYDH